MPSPWLAVGAETDPLARARQLQRSWEHLLADGVLGPELPPEAAAGLRPTIVESWRRSLATGLDPTEMLAPIEVDPSEMRERWLEHPLGQLAHVLATQLRVVAEESHSLVVVTDACGLILHIDGAERLKESEGARYMNLLEGARYSEMADGTNGIGTALAADHACQVFAFEHFNQRHHQWVCSGAPVHDPVSGRLIGIVDLSSPWKIAHPRSLELVTAAARTIERCLLVARGDQDARLRRRYGDLMTRSTDLLVNRYGYVLDGDEQRRSAPLDVPAGGGEVVLVDGSLAVAEQLGDGEAYLVRRSGSHGANTVSVGALKRAERHARDLAAEQAGLRQVATLVARQSSFDQLLTAVANQAARIFDVPLVLLARYESDSTFVVLGGFSARPSTESRRPLGLPVGSRWSLDGPGVTHSIYESGRPARVEDYALVAGELAATMMRSGIRSAVGSPIVVEGHMWGVMVIGSPRPGCFPGDTEARLADFAELMAMGIANAESHAAVNRLADEQAALRRVATMVARGARPEEVFSAVGSEVGRLFGAEAAIARFESDGSAMVVVGLTPGIPTVTIGTRWELEDFLASTAAFRTRRPARNDHTGHRIASGLVADSLRQMDFVSTVAAPIMVESNVWGVITVSDQREPLPADTEKRVERFTELVATAIANAESRSELAASEARAYELAKEQAALRRVATLVANSAKADEVFSAVAQEVALVFDVQQVTVCRYEPDAIVVLSSVGAPEFPGGSRWPLDVPSLPASIYQTGTPARIDQFTDASGLDARARAGGATAAIGVPIVVGGTVWGSINIASMKNERFASDAEERLGSFTELVATSVSNATMREELAASRARVIAASDDARRRIERDLHDGAQQRLVTLAVALRRAEAKAPPGSDVRADITRVGEGLITAVEELRHLSQGIHPAELTAGGLSPALKSLGRRSAFRVELDVGFEHRLPDQVEVAAYYTVSEALTNASKHANALHVWVSLSVGADTLVVSIRDDGVGGADAGRGSGLTGLRDRIEGLGGTIQVKSPPGAGTSIEVRIPILQSFDRRDEAGERASTAPLPARTP
jgi:signal transduction histidine kinase